MNTSWCCCRLLSHWLSLPPSLFSIQSTDKPIENNYLSFFFFFLPREPPESWINMLFSFCQPLVAGLCLPFATKTLLVIMLQCNYGEAKRGLGWRVAIRGCYGLVNVCVQTGVKCICTVYYLFVLVCVSLFTSVAMLWLELLSNKYCTTSKWFSCAAIYSGVKPFCGEKRCWSDLQSWS